MPFLLYQKPSPSLFHLSPRQEAIPGGILRRRHLPRFPRSLQLNIMLLQWRLKLLRPTQQLHLRNQKHPKCEILLHSQQRKFESIHTEIVMKRRYCGRGGASMTRYLCVIGRKKDSKRETKARESKACSAESPSASKLYAIDFQDSPILLR